MLFLFSLGLSKGKRKAPPKNNYAWLGPTQGLETKINKGGVRRFRCMVKKSFEGKYLVIRILTRVILLCMKSKWIFVSLCLVGPVRIRILLICRVSAHLLWMLCLIHYFDYSLLCYIHTYLDLYAIFPFQLTLWNIIRIGKVIIVFF